MLLLSHPGGRATSAWFLSLLLHLGLCDLGPGIALSVAQFTLLTSGDSNLSY